MPSGGQDYESDDDPLGYMTTGYPSPHLYESEVDMQRRFLLGRHATTPLQRLVLLLCRLMVAAFAMALLWGTVRFAWDW